MKGRGRVDWGRMNNRFENWVFDHLGWLIALAVAVFIAVLVANADDLWLSECARYRPLAECKADLVGLNE